MCSSSFLYIVSLRIIILVKPVWWEVLLSFFFFTCEKNALDTEYSEVAIARKVTSIKTFRAPNLSVIDACLKPGTDSWEWQETGCQKPVFLPITVVRMPLDGFVVHIRMSLKEWYRERCVLLGATTVAVGAAQS